MSRSVLIFRAPSPAATRQATFTPLRPAWGGLVAALLVAMASVGSAARAEEAPGAGLEGACSWLERAVVAEPDRDDAFGMYMRSMRPKCQGALEALGRRDGSVTDATVAALVKELEDLRVALGEAPAEPAQTAAEPARTALEPANTAVDPAHTAVEPGGTTTALALPSVESDTVDRISPDTPRVASRGAVSGTWFQAPRKVLDQEVKRTLNLFQRDKAIEGELYEEISHPAPDSWVDASCGGNTTFRMVTTARVGGAVRGHELELRRDVPRVLACTCPSRCRVEQRRRGLALSLSPSGMQLTDDLGVFVREGAPPVASAAPGSVGFAGEWESASFERRGERLVLHLALEEVEGAVRGTLTVRSDQDLPLKSWSDRFCGGADRFARVDAFEVAGRRRGGEVDLGVKDGRVVTCSCPSKCFAPKRRGFSLTMTPDGRSVRSDEAQFERR